MSCERYTDAIVDLACGAPPSPLSEELERHLADCEPCAARLAAQRRLIDGLDADIERAMTVHTSSSFAAGVERRIEKAAHRSQRLFWWSAAGLATAALLLAAALKSSSVQVPVKHRAVPVDARLSAPEPASLETPLKAERKTPVPRPAARSLPRVEVIVPAERAESVNAFLDLVRRHAFDGSNLRDDSRAEPGPPRELVVAPLTIAPIVVPDVEFPAGPVPAGPGLH